MTTVSYFISNVKPEFDGYWSSYNAPSNEYDPAVIALAGGGFSVAYTYSSIGGSPASYYVLQENYNAAGVDNIGGYYVTNTFETGAFVAGSATTQLSNGNILTTWTKGGGTNSGLHYSIATNTGGFVKSDTLIPGTDANSSLSDVAVLHNGGFAVVEQHTFSGSDIDAKLLIFNANGAAVATISLGNNSSFNEEAPAVTVLKNGNIVVAYQKEQSDGSGTYSMALEIYSASGTQIKGQSIFDGVGTQNVSPDVVALKDGGFAIAYSDDGWGQSGLSLAFFDSSGNSRGIVRADADTVYDAVPSVTVLANGFVSVSWTSFAASGDDNILTSVFDPSSLTKVSGSNYTESQSGYQETPSTAGLADGTQVTTWTDYNTAVTDGNTDTQGSHIALQIDATTRYTNGTSANETLRGDALRDLITGGGGDDTFVYAQGGNVDTFYNFTAGAASNDLLVLSGFRDIHSFADVLAHATQNGADTVINFGGTDQLTLVGVTKTTLTAGDFSFNTFDSASLAIAGFGSSAAAGGWSSDDVYHRTLADVNGDGRADIIGFGYDSTVVSLANSSGGFNAPVTGINSFGYSPAGGNWSTNTLDPRTAADVNGDGMADLVGFGYGGTFVALATGGGHFAPIALTISSFGSSAAAGGWSDDNTYHRDVADVNGDGMADLVGFGYDGTYVSLATGGGNFATPIKGTDGFGSSAGAGGWSNDNIYHRELADVNGDGMADIVGFGSDSTYVALATGGGNFADPIIALNGFGSSVAGGSWTDQTTYTRHLADINGDGRADIVGFGYNGTVIAYGNVDGTFQAPQTDVAGFGTSSAAGGWSSNDLYPRLLGDVDGGGAADIVGFGYSGTSVAHSNVNWVG